VDRARVLLHVASRAFVRRTRVSLMVPAGFGLALALAGVLNLGQLNGSVRFVLVAGGLAVATLPFFSGPIARRAAEKMRRRLGPMPLVCPSCGYDLRALPAESDGCTVCPECGAAWRLTPVPAAEDDCA
jgi:hypothetical protein